jgi:hypothetical protein
VFLCEGSSGYRTYVSACTTQVWLGSEDAPGESTRGGLPSHSPSETHTQAPPTAVAFQVPLLTCCLPILAQWTDPLQLHGVGRYAADAYHIFCRGDWRSVAPTDKDLLRYHQWLLETDGQGTGLMRDPPPSASQLRLA